MNIDSQLSRNKCTCYLTSSKCDGRRYGCKKNEDSHFSQCFVALQILIHKILYLNKEIEITSSLCLSLATVYLPGSKMYK